jgi:hypothetical protein
MLNEFATQIFEANKAKGFWDERLLLANKMEQSDLFSEKEVAYVRASIISQLLVLQVSELAEAQEAHRKGKFANIRAYQTALTENKAIDNRQAFELYIKDTFEDEIADTIIRLLDMCGGLAINIDWHIAQKLRYNAGRKKLHGKNY